MMEKKFLILFFLMGFLSFCTISCSDEADNPNEADIEEEKYVHEWEESMKTEGIVQELCLVMTQEDGTVKYEPTVGKALYDVAPTVYYQPVSSIEEAEQVFYRIISPLNTDSVGDKKVEQKEITQGDVHLKFEEGTSAKELARIIVDCPRLRDVLTEVVFMPQDLWPENDMSSPFNYLSVWKQKSTTNIYLCVRKSQGCHGILLTFDGGYVEDWFTKYDHWQGRFYVWQNTAKAEDIEALAYCLKHHNNILKNEVVPQLKTEGYAVLKHFLWGESQTFDTKVSYHYWLWWAYHCYGVKIFRTRVASNGETYSYTDYYKHEESPSREIPTHAIYFTPDEYWERDVKESYRDKYKEEEIHHPVDWKVEKAKNWERLYTGIK